MCLLIGLYLGAGLFVFFFFFSCSAKEFFPARAQVRRLPALPLTALAAAVAPVSPLSAVAFNGLVTEVRPIVCQSRKANWEKTTG